MQRPNIISRRRTRQRGSAMVELALSFLGFIMLIFGVFDFSWAVYAQTFCFAEAQDAVRWASVRGSENPDGPCNGDDVTNFVKSQNVGLAPSSISVETKWLTSGGSWSANPTGNNSPGSVVRVTISYPIIPLSGVGIRQGFDVHATSETIVSN